MTRSYSFPLVPDSFPERVGEVDPHYSFPPYKGGTSESHRLKAGQGAGGRLVPEKRVRVCTLPSAWSEPQLARKDRPKTAGVTA